MFSFFSGYNAWVNFTLPEIGNYTVYVNVSNYVNWMAADVIFPVGERIQNSTVHQIPTLPYGNSTTIVLTIGEQTLHPFKQLLYQLGRYPALLSNTM